MPEAQDIHGTVFKNGSATLLARVVGASGTPITRSQIAAIQYSIFLLQEDDPDSQTPVAGHAGVSVPVSSVIYDSLQTDALWTRDSVGYNFKHVLEVEEHPAFAAAGRSYRIVYELRPAAGQVILVRFRVHAI
ncbi:MAG: hypothetical protein ACUVUC_14325 [Thermoguttaceae bacterium]